MRRKQTLANRHLAVLIRNVARQGNRHPAPANLGLVDPHRIVAQNASATPSVPPIWLVSTRNAKTLVQGLAARALNVMWLATHPTASACKVLWVILSLLANSNQLRLLRRTAAPAFPLHAERTPIVGSKMEQGPAFAFQVTWGTLTKVADQNVS